MHLKTGKELQSELVQIRRPDCEWMSADGKISFFKHAKGSYSPKTGRLDKSNPWTVIFHDSSLEHMRGFTISMAFPTRSAAMEWLQSFQLDVDLDRLKKIYKSKYVIKGCPFCVLGKADEWRIGLTGKGFDYLNHWEKSKAQQLFSQKYIAKKADNFAQTQEQALQELLDFYNLHQPAVLQKSTWACKA